MCPELQKNLDTHGGGVPFVQRLFLASLHGGRPLKQLLVAGVLFFLALGLIAPPVAHGLAIAIGTGIQSDSRLVGGGSDCPGCSESTFTTTAHCGTCNDDVDLPLGCTQCCKDPVTCYHKDGPGTTNGPGGG